MPSLIAPIRKLLIDKDLSESTFLDFTNGFILLFITKEKLLDCINSMKSLIQNNAL
jgi:hypothetical protein